MNCPLTVVAAVVLMCMGLGAACRGDDGPGGAGAEVYRPAATLADEERRLEVKIVEGYLAQRPRLLYGAGDIAGLKERAAKQPELWQTVIASARRLGNSAPEAEVIRNGKTYWRIESVQSGALAFAVTGDKVHAERAIRWMLAHAAVDVWGTGYRSNVDLAASWYLYHIALGYDALHGQMTEAERNAIRAGMADHARAIYVSLDPGRRDPFTYDQNHVYIPTVALSAGALALLGEEPEAEAWLRRAAAVMDRCRYVLGDDGWYYEGSGYFFYAMHWHLRYADLMERATGRRLHDLPALRDAWRFVAAVVLPGPPSVFDLGDTDSWRNNVRGDHTMTHHTMLWGVASSLRSGEAQAVGDMVFARKGERDYPASAFLWFDPALKPAALEKIKPYHHFADHGYVSWRTGWGEDDTAYVFRLGPPEGHAATAKLPLLKDWRMNGGHVHADIGSFRMYARRTYLAGGTGYTAEKWTRDHNTVLIDGVGQASDGTYHNERHYPYDRLNKAKLDSVHLSDDLGFASGEYGAVYPEPKVGTPSLRRSVLMTRRWMLVVDDLNSPRDHKLTWICHSDEAFERAGEALVARRGPAALAVVPVDQVAMAEVLEASTVMAGTSPVGGKPAQRGFHVARTMAQAAKGARLVHLVAALGEGEKAPTVKAAAADGAGMALTITWADGTVEQVEIGAAWMTGAADASTKPPTVSRR